MNRADWIFVAVRLYGLYLLFTVLGFSLILLHDQLLGGEFEGMSDFFMVSRVSLVSLVLPIVTHSILGVALVFGAPRIGRWLESKDARVLDAGPDG